MNVLAFLFIITQSWKHAEYSSNGKWIKMMVYLHRKILFSNKKQWTTDKCKKLDQFQKHYTEWNKKDTKVYILNNSKYMTFWKGKSHWYRNEVREGILVSWNYSNFEGAVHYTSIYICQNSSSYTIKRYKPYLWK